MKRHLLIPVILIVLSSALQSARIGYAFSGGGARGFAHIGMLKVMEEIGLKPQYIAGTSIGALVGGMYAMGYNAAEIESVFVKTDWSDVFDDKWNRDELYIGQKRWSPYGNAFFRLDDKWNPKLPQALVIGNNINLELFRIFASSSSINDFNELPIPFSAVATDLVTGEIRVFESGSLLQSIRASMSIPSILQPFPLDSTLYIDGGLSQNLPGKQVKEMGADYVIGFKVNSTLQPAAKLDNLVSVLDQTINLSITDKLAEQIAFCDLNLEPDLSGFSATDFRKVSTLIAIGEDYARANLDKLIQIKQLQSASDSTYSKTEGIIVSPGRIKFNKFTILGNKYLSSQIIRDYTGLKTGVDYSVDSIIKGVRQAWNSQLFDLIYPVLEKDGDNYILNLYVKESERKHLVFNFAYDRENEFMASGILTLKNILLKNSYLQAELKLGGKNELNLDYVKNFGQAYGVYYHLYPYLEEKRVYFYNDSHERITSARSMEIGMTAGLGMFAKKSIVLEGYGYTYNTNLYREIALNDTLEKSFSFSGVGLKAYHESLDDYVFPTQGARALIKLSYSKDNVLSDQTMNRLKAEYFIFYPFSSRISWLLGLNLGSHLKGNNTILYDPSYLGGLDNFAAYPLYEKSAPYYELIQAGIRLNWRKRLFLTGKVQILNYSDSNVLLEDNEIAWGGVWEAGYQTYVGPVRISIAAAEGNKVQYYLSLGYTCDIFHFSRR